MDIVCRDNSDMLVDDHSTPVDDEGFRNTRRSERDLSAAVFIRSDPRIGVAIVGEELPQWFGLIVNRNSRNLDALLPELDKDRYFGNTRDAPACKHID